MSRRLVLRLLTGAVCVAASCGALAASGEPALAFAWPAGLEAVARFERSLVRTTAARTRTARTGGEYSVAVEEDAGGLRVRFSDMQFMSDGAPVDIPQLGGAPGALLRLSRAQPDVLVDRHGRLRAVLGLEELREETVADMTPAIDALPPGAREVAKQLFDPDVELQRLETRARERWDRWVAVWLQAEPVADGWHAIGDDHVRLPALPGFAVPVSREVRRLGTVPCVDGGPANDCVELELRSRVNTPELARTLPLHVRQSKGVDRIEVSVEERVLLRTEPATLLPHREEHERRSTVTTVRGSRVGTDERVERTTTRISYRPRP